MVEATRRRVLGTLLLSSFLTGCGQTSQEAGRVKPAPSPTLDPVRKRLLDLVYQQVKVLAETYPENSLVRIAYLEDLSKISRAFKGQAKVGIADPTVFSRLGFVGGGSSEQPQFE